MDLIPFPAPLSPGPPEAAGDLIPPQAGGGRVETGASVSLDLALGGVSRSQVCGGERGGSGDGLFFMYLEGPWGIKAPPTPAARCVVFGAVWGKAEEGPGRL